VTWYVLDSNLYIEASRDAAMAAELAEFSARFLPRIFLHGVVIQELMAGAANAVARRTVERELVRPFERRGRLLVPSFAAWRRSGEMVGRLVEKGRLTRGGIPRSFLNDSLIAASCHERGATVITRNQRDFTRIREVMTFGLEAPWPEP
jgi:predicted nucleic acid-binding protein